MMMMLPALPCSAQNVKTVLVLPFAVHSKTASSALQQALAKSLETAFRTTKAVRLIDPRQAVPLLPAGKPVDEASALRAGTATGADYAVIGTLTEFGGQLSADAQVIDIGRGKALSPVYAIGKGPENINALAVRLVGNLLLKISSELRIARIEFKGNRKIESIAINQVLTSSVGGLFSEGDISADIKAIYRMGYFDDVAVDVTDSPEGKNVTFIVTEKPLVTEIVIRGNKAVKKDDIESVLTVKARQIINVEKVTADIAKIRELYDGKGYYNAEVAYAIDQKGAAEARLTYTITENEKVYIRHIVFEGNRSFTAKELKDMMKTSEKGFFHWFTDSGLLKKEELKQDVAKLQAFYLSSGFINVQIGEPVIERDKEGLTVKIPIAEGMQFRVGKVEITGDELKTPRTTLLAKLQIAKKEFYDRGAILKDMDYLTQVSNDEGYANADVNQRLVPHEKEQRVDIVYHITKGNQVYFNRISITGNTKTRDKVIRRQLAIVEGDLYSSSKLKKSYMDLNRLRYFEEINIQTEKGPNETLTDVNIAIKEKPTGIFSIGAGYSAIDHAVLTAQVAQQNLFGRGQTLSVKAHLGSTTTSYELSFVEPWLFDIPLWSKLDAWNFTREYDSYDLDSNGVGVTLGYPIWEYITGYVGYRFSVDDISNIEAGASTLIEEQEGKTTLSSLTFTLTRDTTDDFFFPSQGSKNSASIQYTGGILQGDADFLKYGISSAWFFSLPFDTVFGVRGRAGYIHRTSDTEIPIWERFYLGGMNSLRGLREVGPVDPRTGDVIGGLTMLNFNVEFLYPLVKDAGMKGVIFYDTGNSWESGYYLDDMRQTAGVGIRWYSPIGPLRLEWGYVIDRKDDEPSSRWEFTIGVMM